MTLSLMTKSELTQNSSLDFTLSGIIDQTTVPDIWKQRKILSSKQNKITIDLSNVSHSDSAGIALLICLQKEATERQQNIQFINVPDQLQQIIQLSHLEDILNTQQPL
jgi:phospholipid transport system transporter-binding protein